jgi:putative membrane protein
MVATLIFGHAMLFLVPSYFQMGWMHLKLLLIAMLVAYHLYCGYLRMQFVLKKDNKSSRFYRIFNEVPTLILISVVFLAVLKPF